MKCQKCGAELTEGMKFCVSCGTPVSGDSNVVVDVSETTDVGQVAQKAKKENREKDCSVSDFGSGALLSDFSILGSPKKVAMDFSKAMLSDFNANKMVSLMSENLLNQTMENTDSATPKILISSIKENSKSMEEYYIDEFGENWKIKLEYIDEYMTENGKVVVAINVNYKGTGGFLGLSDREKNRENRIDFSGRRRKMESGRIYHINDID